MKVILEDVEILGGCYRCQHLLYITWTDSPVFHLLICENSDISNY